VRVAIVGGGVSGLVAARRLHDAGHEITLLEAGGYPGGHTNTIQVETDRGAWNVDTGFIVFNDRNYPSFARLLDRLGVATQPAEMSFSVADEAGRFEWSSRPAGLFANPAHLVDRRFHRMLLDLLRFNREARALIGANGAGPSLRRFLADGGYSEYFIERLIVPQVSAIWSADPSQLWSFPASFLAEFFDNHGILGLKGRPRWRTVVGGSRAYVEALIAPFRDRIRLRAPVRRIERHPDRVEIGLDGESQGFDQVVIATHSDQALAMLADPSPAEREILGCFPYQRNEAVLHTDERLLPRRRRAWASWNFHLADEPAGQTAVTYHMNRLQSLSADRELCVTLNRSEAIDPAKVIRTIEYHHPVFTREGVAAQHRHGEISGRNRTHYCGAYWRWGFHEDGVWSALRATDALARTPSPVLAPPVTGQPAPPVTEPLELAA
jgi:predicted NAD/FAD-binding protein